MSDRKEWVLIFLAMPFVIFGLYMLLTIASFVVYHLFDLRGGYNLAASISLTISCFAFYLVGRVE